MNKLTEYKTYDIQVDTETGEFSFQDDQGHRIGAPSLSEVKKLIDKTIKGKKNPPLDVIYMAHRNTRLQRTVITSIGQERGTYGSKEMRPRVKTEGGGSAIRSWNSVYEVTPENLAVFDKIQVVDDKIAKLRQNRESLLGELGRHITEDRYNELMP